ncbi:hypothetical protein BaRGS_00000353 [Batillaria attramentaria]|uniref:Uncharacterized protein n=1 Tax=Batillaria attramentaria TaxID=370345 RepID=A0ABD0M8F8_9CAEN
MASRRLNPGLRNLQSLQLTLVRMMWHLLAQSRIPSRQAIKDKLGKKSTETAGAHSLSVPDKLGVVAGIASMKKRDSQKENKQKR